MTNSGRQLSLFEIGYPHRPGFKRYGTSENAAKEIARESSWLRRQCLAVISSRESTADEVAEILERSVLAIRPRLSELLAKNKIEDSGRRRKNESGKLATVWRTT